MKLTNSLPHPVRYSLAAISALLLAAAGAVAQSSGGSPGGGSGGSSSAGGVGAPSPGSTSSSTDSYNTRSSAGSVSGTTQSNTRGASGTDATSTAGAPTGRTTPGTSSGVPNTTGSTSGAATGSQSGYSTDRATQSDTTGTTYGPDGTRSTTTATTAAESGTMTGRGSDRLSWGDRRFVTKAADSGTTELQLAQLAAAQASNPEVRNYAERLIQDHSQVKSELTTLAAQKNVRLDDDDGRDRAYRRLVNKSGRDFDQEFVEHMVEMHEDDVKRFEKAAREAKDADVRSFASRRVADLRQHLQRAQNLRQAIMPTGRADDYRNGRGTSGEAVPFGGTSPGTPRSDASGVTPGTTPGTTGTSPGTSSSDSDTSAGRTRTTPRGGGR